MSPFPTRRWQPDNLLIDANGHIKLSDFGLCTGFRKSHRSEFFRDFAAADGDFTYDPEAAQEKILTWKKNRRRLAFSTVGTPDYIAPEVFQADGYSHECDWWSVGVIMFEMLCGYPAFASDSSQETFHKIINWRDFLRFPRDAHVSPEARDLIERFCCDASDRIGANGIEEIQAHPFFDGVDWDTIRASRAPFIPQLASATDTIYFDDIPEDVTQVEDAVPPAALGDANPFIGYTFKRFDAGQKSALRSQLQAINNGA